MHYFSTAIAKKIFGNNEQIDLYIYGIELFISSMFCTILLIGVGLVTNTFLESIIFIISFSALRIFTGGYHSNSYLLCTLLTIAIYLLSLLFYVSCIDFISNTTVCILIFLITLITIFFISPVENSNKPLDKIEHKKYKKNALITALIEMIVFFVLKSIFNLHEVNIYIPILISVDILMFLPYIFKERRE